jgi:NAD(P)-dependent dehydrogenase (short-subunit alcohol dehydrogenase family)
MMVKPKIAVLTGATDGMGRVVAPMLGKAGFHVIAQGRNKDRGQAVVDEISSTGGSAEFMACDLSSLADIRRFASELNGSFPRIDLLINNAGIGTGPHQKLREVTVDGLETRFAINYLSIYALTRLVLDKVVAAAPSRIVNVASDGQMAINFDDLQLERNYSGEESYCRAKVAEVMFTWDLAGELMDKGVTANTMHPGSFMDTTMVRHLNRPPVESLEAGSNYLFELATHSKYDGVTGKYFNRGHDNFAHPQTYDREARAKLRAISKQLAGI